MKKLLLILILNISLLFSPPPSAGTTDPNGRYVSLNRHAGFFLNPDTYGFIFPAIHPRLLLENHALRQSRPLFILTGSIIGYSITFLTWPIHRQLLNYYRKFWRGTYSRENILMIGNFYMGYILLNILTLWMAIFLFEKIFNILVKQTDTSIFSAYLLMVFIASNSVTKAFFWTVHQQMFAFLTPLLCVYILFRFTRLKKAVSFMPMAGFSLLAGLLLLVYGNFLLLLPVFLFSFLDNGKQYGSLDIRKSILLKCAFLILLFFIPTLCWIGILKIYGIDYYNFEIKYYHQLIWIPETLNQSFHSFFHQLISNTFQYFLTMKQLLIVAIFSIILLVPGKISISWKENFFFRVLLVFLCFFLFYWMLGFYVERLTNTLIPVVICFWVVAVRQKIADRIYVYKLSSLALIWQLYVLLSYGPFS